MAGFGGSTGVPLKQMQDAIAQSTANVVRYVDIDLSGKAITSAENNVYYLADIDTGVTVPSGFRFVSAMPLAPWSAGISVIVGTRNNSGNLVVGATATKSLTVPSNRKFRVFYIVVA